MVSVISFPLAPGKSGLVSLIFPTEELLETEWSAVGSWRTRCPHDPLPQMEGEDGADVCLRSPGSMWQSLPKNEGAPAHHGVLSPFRSWFARVTTPRFSGMWI